MKIIYSVFLAIAIFTLPMTASALTFKKGQILGPDGKVYDGASPQLRARLIAEAEAGGKPAGVAAGQLFVVVKGTVTFVPLTEIAAAENISAQLDALIASGASEAEIDAFIEANPPE